MARRYDWEHSSESGDDRYPWERDSTGSSGSVSVEDDPNSSAYAASRFLEELLDLYHANAIVTAESVCVLSFWVARDFPESSIKRYGKKPGSGHYQRHLDPLIGMNGDKEKTYQLEIVGNRRRDLARTKFYLPVRPIHECIKCELDEDSSLLVKLDEKVSSMTLPPIYYDNPVVIAAEAAGEPPPIPIALYMDGYPYSQTDSCVGITILNLVTGRRHPIALVRKKLGCKCGCRGWFSFFPIMLWIRDCFRVRANGRMPSGRFDGQDWLESDKWRMSLAN